MTDTRNPNRRIDFKEAGEGRYLLLRNSGTRQLQTFFGENWWAVVEQTCRFYHVENMEKLLGVMVYADEKKVDNVTLDDVDDTISMEGISLKLLDAFSLAMTGRTHPEQQAFMIAEQKKIADGAKEEENPPKSLETSSTVSGEEPTKLA